MTKSLIPKKNTPDKDNIMTPPSLAHDIVDHFSSRFMGGDKFLEPCSGDRAFISAIQKHPYLFEGGTGFIHSCEIRNGHDFFKHSQEGYDWIITNFPFSKYKEFLKKSMEVAENIVLFGIVCHILSLKARLRLVKEAGFYIREVVLTETPKDWTTGGFQCGAIYLSKEAGDCKFSELK